MAIIRVVASATDMPVFFWLWVSLAETPMQNIFDAAGYAAFEALLVEHEAGENRTGGLASGGGEVAEKSVGVGHLGHFAG